MGVLFNAAEFIESELEEIKKEVESLGTLININEKNLMELKTEIKFLREKNEELIKENQNYKSKDQQKEIEYSKKMVEFNQAQKNLTEAREKVFNAVDDVTSYHQEWDWYEAGVPVLRTRYVELVEYERVLFIP